MKLKPCPFCGGEADLYFLSYDRRYFVICEKCDFKTAEFWTEKEAVDAWNKRADERGAE